MYQVYFCQKNFNYLEQTFFAIAIGDCPLPNTNPNDKWVTFNIPGAGQSRFCYLWPNTYMVSWHEANDQCMKRNATLMSIHEYQTNAIMTFLNGDGLFSFTNYWIGLTSLNGKRGDYEWSDGSARPYTNYANTTYNGSPLPPDVRNQGKFLSGLYENFIDNDKFWTGRCVSMMRASQKYSFLKNIQNKIGLWYKEDCNTNHHFICQKRDLAAPTAAPPPTGGCPSGKCSKN